MKEAGASAGDPQRMQLIAGQAAALAPVAPAGAFVARLRAEAREMLPA